MSRRPQAGKRGAADDQTMSTPLRPHTTTAFYIQAAISFAVSLSVTLIGIGYLHDPRWVRAFLALGLLYVVTSAFTLAKCIRDRQEEVAIVSRVDQARLDKLLAEQNLLRIADQSELAASLTNLPGGRSNRHSGQAPVASAPWPVRCGGSSPYTVSSPSATRPC